MVDAMRAWLKARSRSLTPIRGRHGWVRDDNVKNWQQGRGINSSYYWPAKSSRAAHPDAKILHGIASESRRGN